MDILINILSIPYQISSCRPNPGTFPSVTAQSLHPQPVLVSDTRVDSERCCKLHLLCAIPGAPAVKSVSSYENMRFGEPWRGTAVPGAVGN